ncbi:MAG: hypothetical protein RR825_00785 [Ruthenibacterium sp.]
MSRVKIVLNGQGVRALLKSAEMLAICEAHAAAVRERCGAGYSVSRFTGKNRVNASVKAVTRKAKRDNMKNNTILKALK